MAWNEARRKGLEATLDPLMPTLTTSLVEQTELVNGNCRKSIDIGFGLAWDAAGQAVLAADSTQFLTQPFAVPGRYVRTMPVVILVARRQVRELRSEKRHQPLPRGRLQE